MSEIKLIHDAVKYISTSFLIETDIIEDVTEYLPFQIKHNVSANIVSINGSKFLFLAAQKEKTLSANNFLHVKRMYSKFNIPVVLVTSDISTYALEFSKQFNGGWVVPYKFTYIPSLFIHRSVNDITNSVGFVDTTKAFGIIPSYILTYYISGSFNAGFNSSDIIELLGVSKMAFSRAAKDLSEAGLVSDEPDGRSRRFTFTVSRKQVWSHYKNRISPLSTGFMIVSEDMLSGKDSFLSGETALSKYSFLSPPNTINLGICMSGQDRYMRPITPATIDGDYFFKILGLWGGGVDRKNVVSLQIFPYNPLIESGCINKVFLIFSRFNRNDVRVKSSFLELETEVYNELNDY